MRMALGLSQDVFARMLKLTRRQLAEIERGKANPTAETLERIGKVFGFTLGFVPAERPAPARSRTGEERSFQD